MKSGHEKVNITDVLNFDDIHLDEFNYIKHQIRYIVAITPRTGSTALCSAMSKTNILGQPEEFFNPRGPVQYYSSGLQKKDINNYILHIIKNFTNGIFGFKISGYDFEQLRKYGIDEHLFPRAKYIYLDRYDEIAQAVSLYYAVCTGSFHYKRTSEQVPELSDSEYDFEKIKSNINTIRSEKKYWMKYFNDKNIEPLKLVYEDFILDWKKSISQVLAYLNIEIQSENLSVDSDYVIKERPLLLSWIKRTRNIYYEQEHMT